MILRSFTNLKTYLLVFLEGAAILTSLSYMGSSISHYYNFSYLVIGAMMTVAGIGIIIAGRLSGKIVKLTGKRNLVTIGLSLAATADILVALWPHGLIVTVLSIFLLGVGFMLAHSTLLTMATEFVTDARGVAMSLAAFFFMLGGSLGALIGGRVISVYDYQYFFMFFGISLAGLCLLAYYALAEGVCMEEEPQAS